MQITWSPASCMLGQVRQAQSPCCRHQSRLVLEGQAEQRRPGHPQHHQSINQQHQSINQQRHIHINLSTNSDTFTSIYQPQRHIHIDLSTNSDTFTSIYQPTATHSHQSINRQLHIHINLSTYSDTFTSIYQPTSTHSHQSINGQRRIHINLPTDSDTFTSIYQPTATHSHQSVNHQRRIQHLFISIPVTARFIISQHTIQYNIKTCNAPYVTRMLIVGAGMTRDQVAKAMLKR